MATEKKYAKIIDEATHRVQVGVGCPDEYYIEIGMTLMDVEYSDYAGGWYVAGYAPVKPDPTPEEIKQQRISELKAQLTETDYKIIKCSEYQLAGLDLPYDIAELHATRQAMRDEINELEG